MALLFIDSFDHYQTANILSKWTSDFVSAAIAIGKGRCGTNCLQQGGGALNNCIKGINFGSTTGTIGFAYYLDSKYSLSYINSTIVSLGNYDTTHIGINRLTDGSLYVYYNGSPDVQLGLTAPDLVREDHWYFIELQLTVDASAGAFSLHVNNTEVAAATGINTVGYQATPALRRVMFSLGSNLRHYIDDFYALDSTGPAPCNTFLGDCRVEYLRPRANGSSQAWTPVGTPTHWIAVDNIATPDDDGTYVESTTAGQSDTYRYQPTGLPSGPIFGAQLNLYAKKSEIGPRVIAPLAAGVVGPPHVNVSSDNYQYHCTPYGTNPATGLAWTIAEINAAEFGVTNIAP